MTEHPTPAAPAPSTDEAEGPGFNAGVPHATPDRPLSDVARRALLEAADRRAAQEARAQAVEHGGPKGPEPTRYGDWEKNGIISDF